MCYNVIGGLRRFILVYFIKSKKKGEKTGIPTKKSFVSRETVNFPTERENDKKTEGFTQTKRSRMTIKKKKRNIFIRRDTL